MTVQEILILATKELNLPDEVRLFILGTNSSNAGKEEADNLLACFNAVETELAVDYLPLYAEDELEAETGAIFYTKLTRRPIRILGVKDEKGRSIPYQIFPEYIKTRAGKIRVRYTYAPREKTLDDISDYRIQASKVLLAYGVVTEYCLSQGMFEDASVWEKKYKQALKSAYKALPSVVLRTRRWA